MVEAIHRHARPASRGHGSPAGGCIDTRCVGVFRRSAYAGRFFFVRNASRRVSGVIEPSSRVRYVEPAADGRVQIMLDETRQRVISGKLDDAKIRSLLLAAVKDPSDPGLRAETVDILNSRAQSEDVRDVLIFALRHDQNAASAEGDAGLKPLAQEPEVRGALSQVLLTDANPGLRTQAIDLLTKSLNQDDPAMSFDRQVIGAMQELMQRESNAYVRQRCKTALESVKASTETY